MKRAFLIVYLLSSVFSYGSLADERFDSIRHEVEEEALFLSQAFRGLSHYQDALVELFDHSSDAEEWHWNLVSQQENIEYFSDYSTEIYRRRYPMARPHRVIEEDGTVCYLNTFKTHSELSHKERVRLFKNEMIHYERDKEVVPFILDEEALDGLDSATIYNFVLLPSGLVRAALEKPQGHHYHLGTDSQNEVLFTHPNHTVLSGAPSQKVVAAGAFLFYEQDGKKLFFISNKTGHFEVPPESLTAMADALALRGVDRESVIPLMDVDFGKLAYTYANIRSDVRVTVEEMQQLFNIVANEFITQHDHQALVTFYREINSGEHLVSAEELSDLTQYRAHLQRLIEAYRLFDVTHEAPEKIAYYSKHLGKLIEAIHAGRKDKIEEQSRKILRTVSDLPVGVWVADFESCDALDYRRALLDTVISVQSKIDQVVLSASEFHELKKEVRQLGTLFYAFAKSGREFHLSRACYKKLAGLNDQMKLVHDAYVYQKLEGKTTGQELFVLEPDLIRNVQKAVDKVQF